MKKFLFISISLLASMAFAFIVGASEIYFEHTAEREVSRGVEYERLLQITSHGLRDVHILRIPLNDPYIEIAPVVSQQGVGRRETTSALLSAANAVAGVNADFFDMTATYAVHMGTTVHKGQVLSLNAETNRYRDSMAAFFLDESSNPFFRYLHTRAELYVNGTQDFQINRINNVGIALNEPMVFTYAAMQDTAALDIRFPGTAKLVSDGRYVTYVSEPGETVIIPEGGFVLVFPAGATHYRFRYMPGDYVYLSITNNLNINFNRIQTAVGGGGLILQNGETVSDGGYVTTGRQPRSAVGVSREGCTLILMVVDGRGASVGATHTELADLLRNVGAYDAMHFDGGGSATLVVQEQDGKYNVLNNPSEGRQRQVANALGVFDTAEPGEITEIVIQIPHRRVAVGTPVTATVLARDEKGLRFPLPEDANLAFIATNRTLGYWQDNVYTPLAAGIHILNVWHDRLWTSLTLYVAEIAELHTAPLSLLSGEKQELRFSGTGVDGTTIPVVNVIDFTVVPAYLGRVEDGYFHAAGGGTGYVRARLGNAVAYIPVSVGNVSEAVNLHTSEISFSGYPDWVEGNAQLAPVMAHEIPRLEYNILPMENTQAAHMVFDPPLAVPVTPDATPVALRLQVHGDGSGHWLRGRVTDGNGMQHTLDFTRNADFIGWEVVTAQLPAYAPAPFTLDRLWMVTLGAEEASTHEVYFYNLQALYAPPLLPEVPGGTRFHDPLQTHSGFTGIPNGGSHVLAVPAAAGEYRFNHADNLAIINLAANHLGLTERSQWEKMARDIQNADPRHIVLLMNANPLNFSSQMLELFHGMMTAFAEEGRTVIVVSCGNPQEELVLTLRDNVRYIHNVAEIRIFTDGGQIWWYA
jgi:exopolysaccharide biosynthesis protein